MDNKVFHIQSITREENTNKIIQKSFNPHAWEMTNSKKGKHTHHLDICLDDMDALIETLPYCYNNNICNLHWIHMNTMK